MDRDELLDSIEAMRPGRDDIVYLQRCGDDYDWRIVAAGEALSYAPPTGTREPDVWMSFSAAWPLDEPERLRAFFNDLLAELESMQSRADRCRWPVEQPWPHFH
jgi:hypothetical protein